MLTRNVVAAAVRSAGHVARTGTVFASENEIARRIATCRANTCGLWDEATDRCSLAKGGCGCYLGLKRRLAAEKCPRGLW